MAASATASGVLPWLADWNRGHTFGPGYGPHARWHGASEVVSATLEGALALWLLRSGRGNSPTARACVTAAGLLPVLRWGPFNLTLLLRSTSPYDQVPLPQRVLGLPVALVVQDLIAATAAVGLLLHRRAASRTAEGPDGQAPRPRLPVRTA